MGDVLLTTIIANRSLSNFESPLEVQRCRNGEESYRWQADAEIEVDSCSQSDSPVPLG